MPDILHQPDQTRFAILMEGEDAELVYRQREGRITFVHTFVPEAVRGQDLGTALVEAGLAFARETELAVVPACPFVKAYMEAHPETHDLLASR
ncbi:MAG: GNAT family N-acetyltransferase [Rubricoccaceae bacterium]